MAGKEGEAAHETSDGGEAAVLVDGSDEAQCLLSAADGTVFGTGDEGEVFVVVDGEVAHPEHYLAEVGSQNLFRTVREPALVVVLAVKSIADTRSGAPSAALPLLTA